MTNLNDMNIELAIQQYEAAKADGTLDEKYPVIGRFCPCGELMLYI